MTVQSFPYSGSHLPASFLCRSDPRDRPCRCRGANTRFAPTIDPRTYPSEIRCGAPRTGMQGRTKEASRMTTEKIPAKGSRRSHLFLSVLLASVVSVLEPLPQARAQLLPGDILVVDVDAGTNDRGAPGTSDRGAGGRGALFRVSPSTGVRTLLSDFGNAAQGPLGAQPWGVAVEATGTILVIDSGAGLFRVSPSTGARTLLSDFGNAAQGPLGVEPIGVAVEVAGTILVTTRGDFGATMWSRLFRVNP